MGGGNLSDLRESCTVEDTIPKKQPPTMNRGSARKRKLQPHFQRAVSLEKDFLSEHILTITVSDYMLERERGRESPVSCQL